MSLDGEQDQGATAAPLIKLADLAKRWGLTEKEVIEMVRRRGVPFLRMSHSIGRVKWDKVRFSVPAIEQWESTSQERFRGAPPIPPLVSRQPANSKGNRAAKSGSRLGDWRDSSPVS